MCYNTIDTLRVSKTLIIGRYGRNPCPPIIGVFCMRHLMSRSRFYNIFLGAKKRCEKKRDKSYRRYGGRGIRFLWKNFSSFYNDMYADYVKHCAKNGEKNTTLERINNDGDYCKENCRWATRQEQDANRRNSFYIEYNGRLYWLAELCRYFGLKNSTVRTRLRMGWSLDKALTTPVRSNSKVG